LDDDSLWLLRLVATGAVNLGLTVLAGCFASLWMLVADESAWARRRARSMARVVGGSVLWSMAATVFLLWTEAAVMSEQPMLNAAGSVGTVLMRTHVGHAWIIGAAALLTLALSPLLPWREPVDRRRLGLAIACAAAFAASKSWASHAGASGDLLPFIVDWVHLLCVSVWAGVVFVAAAAVLREPMPVDLLERTECARFVETLSTTATWSLAGVVVTGAFSSWRGLGGSIGPLISSTYGEILLVKLALVASAVALGAHNRFAVMPRLLTSIRAPSQSFDALLRTFGRVLDVETFVLLAVLLAAAALGTTAPPATP